MGNSNSIGGDLDYFGPYDPSSSRSSNVSIPSESEEEEYNPPSFKNAVPVKKSKTLKPSDLIQIEESKPKEKTEEEKRIELMFSMRRENLKEILETERRYVDILRVCVKIWLEPLRSEGVIKEEEIRNIFSIIEVILNLHEDLLIQLETRMIQENLNNWLPASLISAANSGNSANSTVSSTSEAITSTINKIDPYVCVADIFRKRGDFLKMYVSYVNNFNNSLTTISICKEKNQNFEAFLKRCKEKPECMNLDLMNFLIAPVQRLPRYQLLLGDLIKNTPENHLDYAPLSAAYEKIKSIAEHVNEQKRVSENIAQIMEIQESLTGKYLNLLEPHRRLKKEGKLLWYNYNTGNFISNLYGTQSKETSEELSKVYVTSAPNSPTAKEQPVDIVYWLFNDILLLAKVDTPGFLSSSSGKTKYNQKCNTQLLGTELKDIPDVSSRKNSLEIVASDGKSFLVATSTAEEKESFIKDFYWERSKASNLLGHAVASNYSDQLTEWKGKEKQEKEKRKKEREIKKWEKEHKSKTEDGNKSKKKEKEPEPLIQIEETTSLLAKKEKPKKSRGCFGCC